MYDIVWYSDIVIWYYVWWYYDIMYDDSMILWYNVWYSRKLYCIVLYWTIKTLSIKKAITSVESELTGETCKKTLAIHTQ